MSNEVFMAREISYNEALLAEKDGVITALREENERLRVALHPFADAAGKFDPDEGDGSQHVWGWSPTIGMLRKARTALQDKRDE